MHYGNIKYNAVEDGIGCRTVLFVSGCRNRCPGCFQKQTWDFGYGEEFTRETEDAIIQSVRVPYVDGVTLLGGEPFEPENQKVLLPFVRRLKSECPGKTVWAYSGYTFEQLTDPGHPSCTEDTGELLGLLDVLVDGKFDEARANKLLPYRGSENQRVIDMLLTTRLGRVVLSPYGERHGRGMDFARVDSKRPDIPELSGNSRSVADGGTNLRAPDTAAAPAMPEPPAAAGRRKDCGTDGGCPGMVPPERGLDKRSWVPYDGTR